MSQQTTFRLVFAALFFLLLGVVGIYRAKAVAGRRIDYSKEGVPMLIVLRLAGLLLWGSCFVYIIRPRLLDWSFVAVPSWLRWAGAAVVLVLIPFVASAQRALGRNVSPTVITHEDHELVTTGPYRLIRNPLYTAGGLIFAALGLVAASWIFAAWAATMLPFLLWRLPREEAELEARFGQEYRDYARRTGRFLPRWSSG